MDHVVPKPQIINMPTLTSSVVQSGKKVIVKMCFYFRPENRYIKNVKRCNLEFIVSTPCIKSVEMVDIAPI